MDTAASIVQRPQQLVTTQQNPTSNGVLSDQETDLEYISDPYGLAPNQEKCSVHLEQIPQAKFATSPQVTPQIHQPEQLRQQISLNSGVNVNGAPTSGNCAPVLSNVSPEQPVCSDRAISDVRPSDSQPHVNGSKPSSAIPRLRTSAIPRFVSSARHSEPINSTNTNSPNRTTSNYMISDESKRENSASLPQTPSTNSSHSFPPLKNSAVDNSDLAIEGQSRSYYSNGRSRAASRPNTTYRFDRTLSEHPQRPDTESDTSSVFSSSGPPRLITSKINSLKNVHHKPGGGNVSIVNEKVQIGAINSKCNSFANVKHKPGGGNVKIVDEKLDLKGVGSKISSLKNVKHVPGGGQTQIVSQKLEFDKNAKSKVGSLKNAQHRAGGGDVQIFREQLPWLKYNKPNLPPEERARINKHRTSSHGDMSSSSIHSGSTGN